MKLHIQVRAVGAEGDLREYAERRLRFCLGRFGPEVREVRLRVEDVHGPGQGIDKRCIARIKGPRVGIVVLEEVDPEASRAIDRVVERLDRMLSRAVQRFQAREEAGAGARRSLVGW